MATSTMREQLYRQIEALPDDLVEQIAKFTQFVQEKRRVQWIYKEYPLKEPDNRAEVAETSESPLEEQNSEHQ